MSYGTCLMMFSRWVSWLPPSDSVQPVGGKPSGKRETSVAHAVFCAVCVVIFCIFFYNIIGDDETNCPHVRDYFLPIRD